jgi:hypothetical protein
VYNFLQGSDDDERDDDNDEQLSDDSYYLEDIDKEEDSGDKCTSAFLPFISFYMKFLY